MSRFFAKYNHWLTTRPLVTNIISTGFLFGAGDVLAQTFELRQTKREDLTIAEISESKSTDIFDHRRLARAVTYGALVFAPLGTRWYSILNAVNVSRLKVVNTGARVAFDQLVFAPFVGIPLYFSVMTAMEGGNDVKSQIKAKLESNWWNTLTANWIVWPAVQTVNFAFVPVHLRLLVVNSISIVWNCYLSMQMNGQEHNESVYILE